MEKFLSHKGSVPVLDGVAVGTNRSYNLVIYGCLYTWLLELFVLGVVKVYGDYQFVLVMIFTLVAVIAALFLLLRDDLERVIYCLGVFLISPQISVELVDMGNFPIYDLGHIFLYTDRLNVGTITSVVLSLALFIRAIHGSYIIKSKLCTIAAGLLFAEVIVFIYRFDEYERLSLYQAIVDYAYLLGAVSWIAMLRGLPLNEQHVLRGMEKVLLVFFLLITLDILVSLTGYVPWSRSYRDTFQGVLFGNEVYFSLVVGLSVVVVAASKSLAISIKTIAIALGLFVLYGTAVKSSYYALILVAAFAAISKIEKQQYRTLVLSGSVILISGISWAYSNFDIYFYFISLWARLGTIIAGATVYIDGNLLFGIGPGILDHSLLSNLAIFIFDKGYADLIYNLNLPTTVVAEILERSEYHMGGEFSPHMAPAALFFSHGLWVLPMAIYCYFVAPIQVIRSLPLIVGEIGRKLSFMYLYLVAFGFFHPVLPIFIMLFFVAFLAKVTCLRKSIGVKERRVATNVKVFG